MIYDLTAKICDLTVKREDIEYAMVASKDYNIIHRDENAVRNFLEIIGAKIEKGVITQGALLFSKIGGLINNIKSMIGDIGTPLVVYDERKIQARISENKEEGAYNVLLTKKEDFAEQGIEGIERYILKADIKTKKEDIGRAISSLEARMNENAKEIKNGKEISINDEIKINEENFEAYLKSIGKARGDDVDYNFFIANFIPQLLLKYSNEMITNKKEGYYFFKKQDLIFNEESRYAIDAPFRIFGKIKSKLLKNTELCFSELAIMSSDGKALIYSKNTTGKMIRV